MPWKVTVMFPDNHKPFIQQDLRLGYAYSTTVEFVDEHGRPSMPPPPPPSRFTPERLPRNLPVPKAMPPADTYMAHTANLASPPPTSGDPDEIAADQQGYQAYLEGRKDTDNPYDEKDPLRAVWANAWARAEHGDDGSFEDD